MEKKSEVFTQFKKFKLLVEKHNECDIKRKRIDKGGESNSTEFAQLCEKEGVEHEIIATFTHLTHHKRTPLSK